MADWKTGRPPHKTICGNKDAHADSLLSPPASDNKQDDTDNGATFPEPEPGHIRFPAALHQIQLLTENSDFDYFFVQPYPLPDLGVQFQDAFGNLFFNLLVKRAMCGPAHLEVYRMFQQLEPSARNMGFSIVKLKAQLKKEYGLDVDEYAKTLPKRSSEQTDGNKKEIEDLIAQLRV